jgi:hypothetical protein
MGATKVLKPVNSRRRKREFEADARPGGHLDEVAKYDHNIGKESDESEEDEKENKSAKRRLGV